jgi:transposase
LLADAVRTQLLYEALEYLENSGRFILAKARWPMHTGQLGAINNKIKVIKRMAYGYRDTDYFFLKIKAVFPGHAR